MSDIAIRVENLSKQYKLGATIGHDRLKDLLTSTFNGLFSRRSRSPVSGPPSSDGSPSDYIWALKDVSFEVKQGEVLGIIGANGAGKSTLLKVLSRITEPTSGRAHIFGRVGSLLEVGTGFDRELTGRENIYLNGAILGMTKREIDRRFDEIVEFSGVEQFIDTPVKRYSSGMYVRLAFAVAAHLEPEILIVDEVLAVGDANFQKKCLGKMKEVTQEGRTVLFVSHNMAVINRLCERVILLDGGRVLKDGPSREVTSAYLKLGVGTTTLREWRDPTNAPGNDIVRLRSLRVRAEDGDLTDTVDIRQPVKIEMEYEVIQPGYVLLPNLAFFNEQGIIAFVTGDRDPVSRRCARAPGRYVSSVVIPGNFLAEGRLTVGGGINTHEPWIVHFAFRDMLNFQVVDSVDGDSARGDYAGEMPGVVRPLFKWTTVSRANNREGTGTVTEEITP